MFSDPVDIIGNFTTFAVRPQSRRAEPIVARNLTFLARKLTFLARKFRSLDTDVKDAICKSAFATLYQSSLENNNFCVISSRYCIKAVKSY